jgi:hypothetical protein
VSSSKLVKFNKCILFCGNSDNFRKVSFEIKEVCKKNFGNLKKQNFVWFVWEEGWAARDKREAEKMKSRVEEKKKKIKSYD